MRRDEEVCALKKNDIYILILSCIRRKNYIGILGIATIAFWGAFSIGIVAMAITPLIRINTEANQSPIWTIADLGTLGDSVGGISGPVIAIVAAALTYLAFIEQVKANKSMLKQYNTDRQESITANRADVCLRMLERFEARSAEMISLYSESLNARSIAKLTENYARTICIRLNNAASNSEYTMINYAEDVANEEPLFSNLILVMHQLLQIIRLTGEMRDGPERRSLYFEFEQIAKNLSVAEVKWASARKKIKNQNSHAIDGRIEPLHDLLQEILSSFAIFSYGKLIIDK